MKQREYQPIIISFFFLIASYFFSRGDWSCFFPLVLGLLLMMAFFKEDIRLFSWIVLSFFSGNLIRFYGDAFLEGLDVNAYIKLIASQFLLIIPILTMCYVIKTFNREIMPFTQRISIKILSSILIVTLLVFILMGHLLDGQNDIKKLLFFLIFASVHVFFQEFIWRGIILPHMIKIVNLKYGILITSLAFAINLTLFGYSVAIISGYLLLGLFLGYLTIKTQSILPAMVVHMIVLFTLFVSGMIHIPII